MRNLFGRQAAEIISVCGFESHGFRCMIRQTVTKSGRDDLGWVNEAMAGLREGQNVEIRPQGGSMRGRIESGQRVTLAPVDPAAVQVDDVVLVEWKGSHLLHLVKELSPTEVLIGNNLGKINGWAPRTAIVAKAIQMHPD